MLTIKLRRSPTLEGLTGRGREVANAEIVIFPCTVAKTMTVQLASSSNKYEKFDFR
jgi:hypothetical protein